MGKLFSHNNYGISKNPTHKTVLEKNLSDTNSELRI